MPDDLYDRDILAWSQHQADLLRRVAHGERVNEVDWKHVVEEIEDVGISQLNAVQSHLRLLLVRLYRSAREQISVAGYAEREPLLPPETCPFTLDQLLNESGRSLQAMLASV